MRRLITSLAVAGSIALGVTLAPAADKPSSGATNGGTTPAPAVALPAVASLKIHAGPESAGSITLRGSDARQQLLVTGTADDGSVRDLTHEVKWSVTPAEVARVTAGGLVIATANGSATVTAARDGKTATFSLSVEKIEEQFPINFGNSVVPVFTKAGCNAGGCHGKSGGQNGFKLSLLGFEPAEDYEHLVKEARGRRLFPAAPEHSLLLTKAVGTMPHGGGKRMDVDTDDYRLVIRWIAQGMPYGQPTDPTVSHIAVHPPKRVMSRGGSQQLVVLAHYTDGTVQDVTRSALYEANEQEMAKISESGNVAIAQQPGDVAVMVRYQGKVATFRATVPLGQEVANLPPTKNYVDELVFKKLKEIGMPPSGVADDATFIRRVTVDIAGRLPRPDEVSAFVKDTSPDKRDKLIDRLLDSPDYADYFANKWANLLRNKRVQPAYARGTLAFHAWVRDAIAENKPYDQFVRELITASGDIDTNPAVGWFRQVKEPSAQLEDTAQLFLGMRLQCAQCHHHPFEKWSQQDYYGFSAFFSRIGRGKADIQGEEVIFHKRGEPSATNTKTKQPVKPAGLGDGTMMISADEDPRVMLANWMTKKDNPFFAKSFANRYWKHFFGRGIVDPEDDMRETNPPTNPELLETLARKFVENGFDQKQLIRDICRSSTYQLASEPNAHNAIDRQNFSRYYPKRLNAEVLLDAVNQLTGSETKFEGLPAGTRAVQLPDNSYNATSYFLTVFGRPDASSSCECERSGEPSLAQSLHLLNAKDVNDKIASGNGRAAKLTADTKRSDEEKVRELYVWAFSREPNESELVTAVGHIRRLSSPPAEEPKPADDEKNTKAARAEQRAKEKSNTNETKARQQAYEDIIWALLNTKEFSFNH
jgi:hypothetical protein